MEAKVIRRYGNRKLYDPANSKYVNTTDVLDMLVSGQKVEVLNNADGLDVTRAVIFSALFEKSKSNEVTNNTMINLLQTIAEHFKGDTNV
jgi:polyhydroxyalkanoate synthesis repressor PhaR